MTQATSQGPELLRSVEDEVKAEIVRLLSLRGGIGPEERERIGESLGKSLADFLSLSWGGQYIYFPKDGKRRAAMMYAEFDGGNHADLARKYGVCVQTVYRVIKQERAARRMRQCSLLDDLI